MDDISNPKEFARSQRKRFNKTRDYRYGGKVGGHSVHQRPEHGECHYRNSFTSRPEKITKTNFMSREKSRLMKKAELILPIEELLNTKFNSKNEINLNKKKRWELIEEFKSPEVIAETENPTGKKLPFSKWDDVAVEQKIYGIADNWTVADLHSCVDYQKKNKGFEPRYVQDRFWENIKKTNKLKEYLDMTEIHPESMKEYERLDFKVNARYRYRFGDSPFLQLHGKSDETAFDEVTLTFPQEVEVFGVGTGSVKVNPGGVSWKDVDKLFDCWITHYNLFYKPESNCKWMPLKVVFEGNITANGENVNRVRDPETNALGLKLKELKIKPLAKAFHHKKLFRAKVYGKIVNEKENSNALRGGTFVGTAITVSTTDPEAAKSKFSKKTVNGGSWYYSSEQQRIAEREIKARANIANISKTMDVVLKP